MNKNLLLSAIVLSFSCISQIASTTLRVTNDLKTESHITVNYRGLFCKNDVNIRIKPGQTWSINAGACLITQITPSIVVDGKTVFGLPYLSSGTGYRSFKIVQQGDQFGVIHK